VIAPGFIGCANVWQAFPLFLSQRLVTALLTISRKLSACVCVLGPFFEITFGYTEARALRSFTALSGTADRQGSVNFLKSMSRPEPL